MIEAYDSAGINNCSHPEHALNTLVLSILMMTGGDAALLRSVGSLLHADICGLGVIPDSFALAHVDFFNKLTTDGPPGFSSVPLPGLSISHR